MAALRASGASRWMLQEALVGRTSDLSGAGIGEMLADFARFCQILPDVDKFCMLLHLSKEFDRHL